MSSGTGLSSGRGRSRSPDFEKCLKDHKIIVFPRAKRLAGKELAAAEEDLAEARDRFANGKYKYATITAYYSIFHSTRALLYFRGYRERSHRCLATALQALYVDEGLLAGRYIRMLQGAMILREDADDGGSYAVEGASMSIACAVEFTAAAKILVKSARRKGRKPRSSASISGGAYLK